MPFSLVLKILMHKAPYFVLSLRGRGFGINPLGKVDRTARKLNCPKMFESFTLKELPS